MKVQYAFIVIIAFLINGCGGREYHRAECSNPEYKPNTAFNGFEDLRSPKFRHLKEKYQLDTIFQGETDEFKRILLIRHWIKNHIKIDLENPHYSGQGYVEGILDAALEGEGFHCGHFARVQNALLNAYGYVTRFVGAGPGVPREFDPHHGTNEVWLNSHNKWMVIDAKYEHHFEKKGIPLSALDIRDEFLKNKADDVVMLKGLKQVPTDFDHEIGQPKEAFTQTFTWITYEGNSDLFTSWPNHKEIVLWHNDEYFKNHTWIRSGKPHWAYEHPEIVVLEENRDAIEWTPNTIKSDVEIDGNAVTIRLISDTPNLKEYQMKKLPAGEWEKVDNKFTIKLNKRKHTYLFRTVNLADVTGPEHKIIIES